MPQVKERLASRTRELLAIVAGGLLALLGMTWSWASPAGSSADEAFHLSSIWCAWGNSVTCIKDPMAGTVLVPERVARADCMAQLPEVTGRCSWLLTESYVPVDRINPSEGGYPPGFYSTMRALVGPDVSKSVLMMRMFNSVLAGILLTLALILAPRGPGRAVAVAWMVTIIPTGVFFIASVNPSSWAIIGGGFFWVFLWTFIRTPHWLSWRGLAALILALLTAAMAVLARSDSAWVLSLSILAVAIMEWRLLRQRLRRAWVLLLIIPLVAIALFFRVGNYLENLRFSFPSGNAEFDQPNPVVKTLAELPAFIFGILGGQRPSWMQRESVLDLGVPGFVINGFSYGVGALDTANPSIAGVLAIFAAVGAVFVGFSRYSKRKVLTVALLAFGIVTMVLVMRSLASFGSWENEAGTQWALQPRYFLPLVMVTVGFIMVIYPASHRIFTKAQSILIVSAMSLAAFVALLGTTARYMHGQAHSWTQLNLQTGWWWSWGPSPVVLVFAGLAIGIAYFTTAMLFVQAGAKSKPAIDRAKAK